MKKLLSLFLVVCTVVIFDLSAMEEFRAECALPRSLEQEMKKEQIKARLFRQMEERERQARAREREQERKKTEEERD